MKLTDIIVLAVVAAIIGLALWHIYSAKRKGVRCVGCPDSKTCSGHCGGCSGHCSSGGCPSKNTQA